MDATIKIGGEAGQGIQTVGDLIAHVCHREGLYLLAVNDFESRIRGGHSFLQIRVSDAPTLAPSHVVGILVALNQRTFDLHQAEVPDDGVILANDPENSRDDPRVLAMDIDGLAKKAGGAITANTVAAGAALAVLGADFKILEDILTRRFAAKGDAVTRMNVSAARLGYETVRDPARDSSRGQRPGFFPPLEARAPKGALINGSRAAALGALAADARLAAFYPMSPATGIMSAFDSFSDDFPIVTEQAEDEIAAMCMVIGAAYAGVRAMTATSGGGFCLMTEALGLAGMAEIPVVIINAQRPGPATGLPTRTGQSDLLFVIHASQDEFPRFVFAPSTPCETFETMIRAFHLSDQYQVPAIVLMDQYLCDSVFVSERPLTPPKEIRRFITGDESLDDPAAYKRFALTPDGVSPRILPCAGKALLMATGNEHDEEGHISEDAENRNRMVEKRLARFREMKKEMSPPDTVHEGADLMLISWGSSNGATREAMEILNGMGVETGHMAFTDMWPFPGERAAEILSQSRRVAVVEANSQGQLGKLLRQETGAQTGKAVLKYDGRPFYPADILKGLGDWARP
ncbi:2-oxoglutarate ferredoxin oxidoreductase subunit alpha KorA [Candidatus Desulfarcum epimagneticum]|uniref:2-oxoglutarate ferredoxin oxidoreductase subunit alpha KorA n=1 Tax=uncultured Desulfobacteraceae bacterium TaxID=218296 RepID=A0A484HGK3_9BACT|nr:2-oxoglutarate ferredoxin oxidoreductase subunit alpha KorA [uncultured Desulfobacteraceae bacterium]